MIFAVRLLDEYSYCVQSFRKKNITVSVRFKLTFLLITSFEARISQLFAEYAHFRIVSRIFVLAVEMVATDKTPAMQRSRARICRTVRAIPKGLQSFSPALTRSGYTGSTSQIIINPNGVASSFRTRRCNPFRVDKWIVRSPGVARSSQPQAE
jgi:hypothetical protein